MQIFRGGFDKAADDHGGARSDGGAAVGHVSRVWLKNFDEIASQAEGVGGNLREDGVRALAHFRAAGKNAYDAFRRGFEQRFGSEIFLA